ncbi:MAG: hypothetical protein AAF614_02910 [Chloroflexota bacterium]
MNENEQVQSIQLTAVYDIADLLTGFSLISVSVNHSASEIYLLAVEEPIDYRIHKSGASFPKLKVETPQIFVVYRLNQYGFERIEIPKQTWNYHFVQPLPNDELLLVCSRCAYRGYGDFDLNGNVFGVDGVLKRSFLLGDGIQDVQTTADGRIWTGYFDEGVFGNYGWKQSIGATGLVLWDGIGNKLYEYSPVGSLDYIIDCYALNVTSNQEVWCCYYTEFPLVRLQNQAVIANWNSRVSGSDGFAVWKDFVLFRGGYKDHDQYVLCQLHDREEMSVKARYEFIDEDGQRVEADHFAVRGSVFHLVQNNKTYKLDMRSLV